MKKAIPLFLWNMAQLDFQTALIKPIKKDKHCKYNNEIYNRNKSTNHQFNNKHKQFMASPFYGLLLTHKLRIQSYEEEEIKQTRHIKFYGHLHRVG